MSPADQATTRKLLGGAAAPIEVVGEVRWVDAPGMGVRFDPSVARSFCS